LEWFKAIRNVFATFKVEKNILDNLKPLQGLFTLTVHRSQTGAKEVMGSNFSTRSRGVDFDGPGK